MESIYRKLKCIWATLESLKGINKNQNKHFDIIRKSDNLPICLGGTLLDRLQSKDKHQSKTSLLGSVGLFVYTTSIWEDKNKKQFWRKKEKTTYST